MNMRHVCLISFLMMIALSACTTKSSASYTEEEIQEIASSDDYDAMIDAMYACVDECGAVKDEYLDGNMPDKEAKSKIDEITDRYAPVLSSLESADSRGDLNYDQHKALIDITKQAMNHVMDGVNKVMDDIGISGDDIEDAADNQ
jgi:ABC-type cobalt transport system substrate-binding protein